MMAELSPGGRSSCGLRQRLDDRAIACLCLKHRKLNSEEWW